MRGLRVVVFDVGLGAAALGDLTACEPGSEPVADTQADPHQAPEGARRKDRRHRPRAQRSQPHRPGIPRPAGVQRADDGGLRHHGYADRQWLQRGGVQFQRRDRSEAPAARRRGQGRTDQEEQRRPRPVRGQEGRHPQRCARQRRDRHPRRRRPGQRARLHGARADRRRTQRRRDRDVRPVRHRRALRVPRATPRSGSATTTAPTATSTATTSPG